KRNAMALPTSRSALIARAAAAPFGPCWVSAGLFAEADDEEAPALVSIIITRRLQGLLLPSLVLVDRTCLGIKSAFQGPLQAELDIERLARELGEQDPLERAEPLVAQSVIFHALDYARSLGFEPHRDFVPELIGERPAQLLDTPLARPERPFYAPGPEDDVARVLARLEAGVGPGGYDFAGPLQWVEDDSDEDWDEDDDADVLNVEGSEVLADEASTKSTAAR
ncbi:MAG TPA: hypothetical protein VG963_13125, partial [Polyangiaceae bacterium]|nr:hypothetical protein [Polyangiaceae bacterium]